jgi:hypothetical protein
MSERIYQTQLSNESPLDTAGSGVLVIAAPATMAGRQVQLRTPEEVLGRHGSVVLNSPTVSREHARVWVANGEVRIADLASANGTFVNGEPVVGQRALVNGDQIRIGDVEAAFYAASWLVPWERLRPLRADGVSDPALSDPALSDSTRHLCAATHLDSDYREHVLDATVRERHRAVSPSYGVDLSVVARHAMLAHGRALLRDAGLAVVLIVAVSVVAFMVVAGRASFDMARVSAVLGLGAAFLVPAWVVLATETWARLATLGKYLRPGGRPDLLPSPVRGKAAGMLESLADASRGNVVVYSVYEPFVGSGVKVDSSSYPVPLLPRNRIEPDSKKPIKFGTNDLVDAIRDGLSVLLMQDLRIDRQLFVEGFDVSRFIELLPDHQDRPLAAAPGWLLEELIERPTGAVRPYLRAQYIGWRGELVVTTFIRVVVLNGLFFVETATYVLGPLLNKYLAVDSMHIRTGWERASVTIGKTTTRLIPDLLAAPVRLAAMAGARRRAAQRERDFARRLADRVPIDRGARSSIRQEAARGSFDRYFMQLDAEMAILVVQQKVADTIAAFLEVRGYQVDKMNMIQNNISNTTTNDNSIRVNNQGNLGAVGRGSSGNASGGHQQNNSNGGTR